MKHIFVLSKENLRIAREEVVTILKANKINLIKNILLVEISNNSVIKRLTKRLAYTNSIYALLFESNYGGFINDMENFDWGLVYKDNFCVRANMVSSIIKNSIKNSTISNKKNKVINEKYSEKNLASYVWKKVKKPEVNLETPKTHIEIFFTEDRIFCGLLLKKLRHTFEERKSHLRPRPSPVSLHPKLARAMVNLTGAKENDLIVDPFCGSGGILIEAGLMGMKTVGYDINKKMVWKSMVNLRHYKIKNYRLAVKDFFKICRKYNYIVSDLPYGLNTNIMENIRVTKHNRKELNNYLKKFYSRVIKQLEKILLKRAVIIFPSYIDYKKILKNSKLKLRKEFESYVHSSLTRKILVLEATS
ncbi:methyltransferase domain-containing protein [Candidatus Woesearchaeota archaeon]|nr:methyltransferase domain-containing protein [Candidatus Woesearchaeota archaeon]